MERLDKIVSKQCCVSRKDARILIWKGSVKVDGKVVKEIDLKIDPESQSVDVGGKRINYREHLYIMMNKPSGVISASEDPKQKTVLDILPQELFRNGLFPAGRLDIDTEGLLIITDDGEFSHKMLSPRNNIYKVYEAELDGSLSDDDIKRLESGIEIDGGEKCLPAKVEILRDTECNLASISICEGKYHQVKRMFKAVGRKVLHLKRVKIGDVYLDASLGAGEARELTVEEIKDLIKK